MHSQRSRNREAPKSREFKVMLEHPELGMWFPGVGRWVSSRTSSLHSVYQSSPSYLIDFCWNTTQRRVSVISKPCHLVSSFQRSCPFAERKLAGTFIYLASKLQTPDFWTRMRVWWKHDSAPQICISLDHITSINSSMGFFGLLIGRKHFWLKFW